MRALLLLSVCALYESSAAANATNETDAAPFDDPPVDAIAPEDGAAPGDAPDEPPVDDEPVEVPPPTPIPTTPASTSVSWCSSNADCRGWGDSQASCRNGGCQCSTGFAHPSENAKACTLPADFNRFLTRQVRVRIDGVFHDGDCARFDGLHSAFEGIWRTRLGARTLRAVYGCGSVYYSLTAEVENNVLASASNITEQVAEDIAGDTGLAAALGNRMTVAMVTGANVLGCGSQGALVSANVNGVCKALSCEQGYDLVTSKTTSTCKRQASSSSSSSGTVVAIILGAAAALLAIMGIGYYIRSKQAKQLPAMEDTEMGPRDSPDGV